MQSEQPFHVFSAEDVRTALSMAEAVEAMKGAFPELHAGVANQDLSAAHVVLERGTTLGLGSCVSL